VSWGTELRECSHESEAATPLLGDHYEEVHEKGVVGILCVRSVFLNGLNRRQNHGRAQGFRSFEVSGQGSAFLLPSLFCSPALFPSQRPSVTEHILSTVFTVVRSLAYPIPTYHNATCLSLLRRTQTHTTEPNSLPSFVIFPDPLLPLATPRRCLGLCLVHPFSPPSLLVHMLQPFLFFILSIPTVPKR
jgi:hypothetical protein